ncbi:MAG: hypothetical protein AAGD04_03565 [Pseudomonadota bacterium]
MTLHTDFNTGKLVEGSIGQPPKPRTPEIDPKRIRQLSIVQGQAAAREYASSAADRVNAGLQARTEATLADVRAKIAHIEADIARFRQDVQTRGGVFMRRTNVYVARMTFWERVQCAVYLCMTIVALVVAVSVVAAFILAGADSLALVENPWRAVGYAFPIVLFSSALASCYLTLKDDEEVIEARIQSLVRVGVIVFVTWLLLTGIDFVSRAGGISGGADLFAVNPDDPFAAPGAAEAGITGFYSIVGALFPQSLTGTVLLTMHVLSEVILAALLTAKVILMDRKLREQAAYECPKAVKAQERINELELAKTVKNAAVGQLTETLAEIASIKANVISEVTLGSATQEFHAKSSAEKAAAHVRLEQAKEAVS